MDAKALESLRDRDWDAIFLRVLKVARILAVRYGWNENTSLPNGQMLEDLVIEAVTRLWESPQKVRDDIEITTQLATIVRGLLWNLSTSSDAPVKRSNESAYGRADDISIADAEERDYQTRMTDMFDRALNLLRDHPKIRGKEEHELVLLAIECGAMKPHQIAEQTGLQVQRVYQITREIELTYPSISDKLRATEAPKK